VKLEQESRSDFDVELFDNFRERKTAGQRYRLMISTFWRVAYWLRAWSKR
jgi:hypothetical protein